MSQEMIFLPVPPGWGGEGRGQFFAFVEGALEAYPMTAHVAKSLHMVDVDYAMKDRLAEREIHFLSTPVLVSDPPSYVALRQKVEELEAAMPDSARHYAARCHADERERDEAWRKLAEAGDRAAAEAHRACCGTEHDPANGKLHGYCIVCGVPWPCDTAKHFLRPGQATAVLGEGEGGKG